MTKAASVRENGGLRVPAKAIIRSQIPVDLNRPAILRNPDRILAGPVRAKVLRIDPPLSGPSTPRVQNPLTREACVARDREKARLAIAAARIPLASPPEETEKVPSRIMENTESPVAPRSNETAAFVSVTEDRGSRQEHSSRPLPASIKGTGDFYFKIQAGDMLLRFHSDQPDFATATLEILSPDGAAERAEAKGTASGEDRLEGLQLFLERMRFHGVKEILLNGRPLSFRGIA